MSCSDSSVHVLSWPLGVKRTTHEECGVDMVLAFLTCLADHLGSDTQRCKTKGSRRLKGPALETKGIEIASQTAGCRC